MRRARRLVPGVAERLDFDGGEPVLMAYGGDDVRVPMVHGMKMRHAILANAGHVEWVVYSGDGHGLSSPTNRADHYRRVEAFLEQNLK